MTAGRHHQSAQHGNNPQATWAPTRWWPLVVLAAASIAAWTFHHIAQVVGVFTGHGRIYGFAWAFVFAMLAFQWGSAWLNRPVKVRSHRARRRLDEMYVVAVVPVYHEDPDALERGLQSMTGQSRVPNEIFVVDDGSDPDVAAGYEPVRERFFAACVQAHIKPQWHRQDNAGKRHAQAAAVQATPYADVYWTTDSDTISDQHALAEGLKPFADPGVQSVAGVVMALNVSNLFTRLTEVWFLTGQLLDRSSMSVLGSVWVNSGPIAFYRAEVIRDNLDGYLNETFFGQRVMFSDDSMLTLYAMLRGRTVQQPTALAFSLMPERVPHHLKQFLRWMRGSSIRSIWRVRYLPLLSPVWWMHVSRWVQAAVSAAALVLVAATVDWSWHLLPWLALVPIVAGYAQTTRYLCVRRSDQTALSQLLTWLLLTPAAVAWAMTVLRVVRWYGVLTCRRTGWGTRKTVEVTLAR